VDGEYALGGHLESSVGVAWEHEELAPLLAPEDGGWRVAPGDALEGGDSVHADGLVLGLHDEHRRRCKREFGICSEDVEDLKKFL
jgi:hypothetical protein